MWNVKVVLHAQENKKGNIENTLLKSEEVNKLCFTLLKKLQNDWNMDGIQLILFMKLNLFWSAVYKIFDRILKCAL